MNTGALLIIGGKEDKDGDCLILDYFVRMAGDEEGCIAVVTAASAEPDSAGREYGALFTRLGAKRAEIISISDRGQANSQATVDQLSECSAIFFTGGDQLRLTGLLAGTRFDSMMRDMFHHGLHIAGTSAGASAMSDTMIVGGQDDDPPKKCTIKMAPGLGLVSGSVIDQHFAERGRLGRLLSAVAQGPHVIGLGIDEDTSIIVSPDDTLRVLGSQTVTVIDAHGITHTNASERSQDEPLALANVRLHILPDGYGFDLKSRIPLAPLTE